MYFSLAYFVFGAMLAAVVLVVWPVFQKKLQERRKRRATRRAAMFPRTYRVPR